jgi:hypothetical protein
MLKGRKLWLESMASATPSDIVLYLVGDSQDALDKAASFAEKELNSSGSAEESDGFDLQAIFHHF